MFSTSQLWTYPGSRGSLPARQIMRVPFTSKLASLNFFSGLLNPGKQCCGSVLASMRKRIQPFISVRIQILGAKLMVRSWILTWKYTFSRYCNRSKNTPMKVQSLLKGSKPGLFFKFCSISILPDPDPQSHDGSGSRTAKSMRIRVQWFWHFLRNLICFMCF